MDLPRIGFACVLVLGLAQPAWAQSAARTTDDAPGPAARFQLDVSKLPLDLERLQRELRQATVREEREGLNLRYTVEVLGQAPPLAIFTAADNLTTGPVPYGAPTHREIVEHITPREYRAPAADISALIRWLAERAQK